MSEIDADAGPIHVSSDARYHARHTARSLERARCIASHIEPGSTVLDVGCNRGITSAHLLDSGVASSVTGVELHASTVPSSLRSRSGFELVVGDIASLRFEKTHDYCVYGAVHHHVLHLHGLSAAVETFRSLAHCSERSLFFETGHLAEGGRWGWQRSLRRYFRTDEEHLYYMLSTVEHAVTDHEVIGRFSIHGIRRAYIRIDFPERSGRGAEPSVRPEPVRGAAGSEWFGRPFGSAAGGRVPPTGPDRGSDSPVSFRLSTECGLPVFVKRHDHRPHAAVVERHIGGQVERGWAVRPLPVDELAGTLVFPHVRRYLTLQGMAERPSEERRAVAKRLVEIFVEARETLIAMPASALLPCSPGASLTMLCDINPGNVLIVPAGGSHEVRIVDFEQHGVDCRPRNRLNLARMLWTLRERRARAFMEMTFGIGGWLALGIRHQFQPFDERVRRRQPGILSLLVTEIRSRVGRVTGRVLSALVGRE